MTRTTDKPYINASYWESLHSDLKGSFGAVGYPELGEGFNRATYTLRLEAVERMLKRQRVLPVNDLLEGGVGIGAYGPLWEKSGVARWTGLDIAVSAIEHVAKKYPCHQFLVADLSNKTEADAVYCGIASSIWPRLSMSSTTSWKMTSSRARLRISPRGYG